MRSGRQSANAALQREEEVGRARTVTQRRTQLTTVEQAHIQSPPPPPSPDPPPPKNY